jgi:DNA-binding GntR family transcriptional regulator
MKKLEDEMSSESLAKIATKYILNKIRTSEILPGEIITESQICESINISRTPVREAIINLVANGILEKVPRKGYKLSETDNKYKIDIYVILGTMDALAAGLSINNITEQDIRGMKEIVELIDVAIKYENYVSYVDLQEKFHSVYIDKCDNEQLKKMIDDIKSNVSRYTYYSEDADKLFDICRESNNEHREIIKLFEKKDTIGLEDYLKNTHWITKHFDMI